MDKGAEVLNTGREPSRANAEEEGLDLGLRIRMVTYGRVDERGVVGEGRRVERVQ